MKFNGRSRLLAFSYSLLTLATVSCASDPSNGPLIDATVSTETENHKTPSGDTLRFMGEIYSIFEDSKGNYWFGTQGEGIAMFDPKKDSISYFNQLAGLSSDQTRSIQEDKHGNIWFEGGYGVTSYDGENFTIHGVKKFSVLEIGTDAHWTFHPDDLWFHGGAGSGVYHWNGSELENLTFPIPEGKLMNGLFQMTDIAKGKNGRLWFATYPAVLGIDPATFLSDPGSMIIIDDDSLGFKSNNNRFHVRSVLEDSKGNLWIGNNGTGVLFSDGDTIVNFTEQHGLGSPHFLKTSRVSDDPGTLARVFSIDEDDDGNIWFGTADAHVWRYDGTNLRNFTQEDGFTTSYIRAVYKDKQGQMWFGGGAGRVYRLEGERMVRVF